MPVSGIVITCSPELDEVALRGRLARFAGLELGPSCSSRMAATLVTDDVERHEATIEELETTPGVLFVELAFHDLSDVERTAFRPRRARSRGESHGTT